MVVKVSSLLKTIKLIYNLIKGTKILFLIKKNIFSWKNRFAFSRFIRIYLKTLIKKV